MEFLQQNLIWVVLAAVSGALLLWNAVRGEGGGVTPQDAVHLLNRENGVCLDLRDASEYKSGHVPNARNIPFAALEDRLKELEKFKERPIIVYGANTDKAVLSLQKNGFSKACALSGGLAAWQEAGMPVDN